MKHFSNIAERVAFYLEDYGLHPPVSLEELVRRRRLQAFPDASPDPANSLGAFADYSPAESRTIPTEMQILMMLYRENGTEYSIQPGMTMSFYHQLPHEGILHKHGYIEILYVIDGSFDQILMGERRHFEKGEFVITDQNCEHSDYLTSDGGSVIFIQLQSGYMNSLLRNTEQADELQRFLFHALESQKREQSFLELREDPALENGSGEIRQETLYLLELLFSETHDYANDMLSVGGKEIQRGLLIRLLRHMCTSYSPILHASSRESKDQAILYALERYIRLHYADVTSAVLEEVFHYHRNYFNLLLRKYRGKTFKAYLLDLRLSIAYDLLRTSDLSVKDIAHLVGYENTSHFYHLYEAKYKKRPRV